MFISISKKKGGKTKVRQQSGVVPYKVRGDGKIFVLMITTVNQKDWGFPKGGIEPNMTPEASALKEAREEAGIKGRIVKRLGNYKYKKSGEPQKVRMFSMEVTGDSKKWDEKKWRTRDWFPVKKAYKYINKEQRRFLKYLM